MLEAKAEAQWELGRICNFNRGLENIEIRTIASGKWALDQIQTEEVNVTLLFYATGVVLHIF